MTIDRRTFLAAASGLVLSPAFAEEALPVLAAYERETGGRIGLYAVLAEAALDVVGLAFEDHKHAEADVVLDRFTFAGER